MKQNMFKSAQLHHVQSSSTAAAKKKTLLILYSCKFILYSL